MTMLVENDQLSCFKIMFESESLVYRYHALGWWSCLKADFLYLDINLCFWYVVLFQLFFSYFLFFHAFANVLTIDFTLFHQVQYNEITPKCGLMQGMNGIVYVKKLCYKIFQLKSIVTLGNRKSFFTKLFMLWFLSKSKSLYKFYIKWGWKIRINKMNTKALSPTLNQH